MGNLLNKNNIVSESNPDNTPQPESRAPEYEPDQHPSNHKLQTTVSANTASPLKTGLLQKNAGDMCDNCYRIHRKASGKPVDPRLLTILEFFRQLYVRRQEVFKKSFPDLHHGFDELFKKEGKRLSQVKSGRMEVAAIQRSSSVGSGTARARDLSGDNLKLERFKVRTLDIGGGGGGKQGGKGGGQGDQTKQAGGSK